MKFNKWTYGLAAVGAVSLTSAAHAEEKLNAVQTALSNTTISGYVSASANVALNGANRYADSVAPYIPYQAGKQDGFNLDVVKLSISKPQDESPWASGYQVDVLFGPDATAYGTDSLYGSSFESSNVAIKQAYIALRTPVGNGIDWKIGVFDTIIGYEVFDAGSNPNYTRSWGFYLEPTAHTGVLATYKVCDALTLSAGVANTTTAPINGRNEHTGSPSGYWKKTVMGSAALTAPSDWGWAAGSMLYVGAVYGFNNSLNNNVNQLYAGGDQFNGYVGGTLNTPWKALTLGAAFDYVQNLGGGYLSHNSYNYGYHSTVWTGAVYATWKATDKLSLSARGEYIHGKTSYHNYSYNGGETFYNYSYNGDGWEVTGTLQYDLWANVISRLEVRYDKLNNSAFIGVNNTESLGLYANIIYKF